MRSQFFKAGSILRPAALGIAAAGIVLSGCTTASLTPSETLTQGYVIDEQALELVPVGSSREQVLGATPRRHVPARVLQLQPPPPDAVRTDRHNVAIR